MGILNKLNWKRFVFCLRPNFQNNLISLRYKNKALSFLQGALTQLKKIKKLNTSCERKSSEKIKLTESEV